ncbi:MULTISPECIES: YlbF family regulator [unclassified Exiguobacterium]|uniref:YlbF family regulator n=1 Tax=unclassified Exiguobacterium TaxID=2644629 RepID=UPI00103E0145|nr:MULTISPECIES: YlbF family regulator [unclassified Exiguobacterium]TCI68895.1 YlbF family regulator [Exiguobacterium sp. IPCI3]TCI78393.1 YlbF family regulator [Exiguobacterium sp. IPCH1]TCI79650.1 YlbF family regulator [Exiguobacterium sp. IPBC4]
MSQTNLYDHAYQLEKALRDSEEFTNLSSLYDCVNADAEANQLFADFRDIQMTLQQKQMQGEEISEQEMMDAQTKMMGVQQNELIMELMQEEQRMHQLVTEVTKIIMKPLEELYAPMVNDHEVQ